MVKLITDKSQFDTGWYFECNNSYPSAYYLHKDRKTVTNCHGNIKNFNSDMRWTFFKLSTVSSYIKLNKLYNRPYNKKFDFSKK